MSDWTLFDVPVPARWTAPDGSTEIVSMLGSDLSRTRYGYNALLIRCPDGSELITSEAHVRSPLTAGQVSQR